MVQTRAAVKRVESGQELPQDTVAPSPPKKRQRDDAKSPRKRRRGKPGELCQLNLDVLFLIAGYIHPLDLLNLARTCKSLRELLMDRSSAFVWKTALRQVKGLPDCPADLTEPEYANLLFYARCHGCSKYTKKILWSIRRRYCPECRDGRLYPLSSCPDVVHMNDVLPMEGLIVEGENAMSLWVDRAQMDSFLQEYARTSDKKQFLSDKRNQLLTISQHASKCKYWEKGVALERRYHLEFRRQQRDQSIFARLREHGYEPEITYFGHYAIRQSCKSFFKTSKPLTDKEWTRMWPEWLETMTSFRSQRIERTVYQPRRDLLATEYDSYITSPSSGTPTFDLLPHVIELSFFPPFRDVIKAPEGTEFGAKPFESAFEQLPVFIEGWRKQLDVELAELVKIPSHLLKNVSSDESGLSSPTWMKSPQVPTAKLRLACAVFSTGNTATYHPDVFSIMPHFPDRIGGRDEWECAMPIQDRFYIKFLEDAPYTVHACGLDPNVATAEDMDHRNARLKCLACKSPYIRTWRGAMSHIHICLQHKQVSCSKSLRWEIVSDEYMDAIQAAELSAKKVSPIGWMRCLLCRPSVGDAILHHDIIHHFVQRHDMERDAMELGVHYTPVGFRESCMVAMVEEEGRVIFKSEPIGSMLF